MERRSRPSLTPAGAPGPPGHAPRPWPASWASRTPCPSFPYSLPRLPVLPAQAFHGGLGQWRRRRIGVSAQARARSDQRLALRLHQVPQVTADVAGAAGRPAHQFSRHQLVKSRQPATQERLVLGAQLRASALASASTSTSAGEVGAPSGGVRRSAGVSRGTVSISVPGVTAVPILAVIQPYLCLIWGQLARAPFVHGDNLVRSHSARGVRCSCPQS